MIGLLGLLILHSLWQGLVIAIFVRSAQPALEGCSSAARARLYAFALAMLPLTSFVTLAILVLAPAPAAGVTHGGNHLLAGWLPAVGYAWMLGVSLAGSRLGIAWQKGRRVRRHAVEGDEHHQALVQRLAAAMGLRRVPALLESVDVMVPTLVGLWRPALLVPLGLLADLPPRHLELLLRHELAHLRRLDPLINFLQCLVEVAYFFHPATWWLSNRLRDAREQACDELAVETVADRPLLARALANLEEQRSLITAAALSAAGGSLMQRIKRLVSPPPSRRLRARALVLPLSILLVSATLVAAACDTESAYTVEPRAQPFAAEIDAAADEQDVPAALLVAMIGVESNFDPDAQSPAGAQGLMQLMPKTADAVGVDDVWDPRQNILGGATYLRQMMDRYEGDLTLAAAAYNAGPNAVDAAGGIPDNGETPHYVHAVLERYAALSK